nr:4674_t:CDS:2 [Entrophospora candida]
MSSVGIFICPIGFVLFNFPILNEKANNFNKYVLCLYCKNALGHEKKNTVSEKSGMSTSSKLPNIKTEVSSTGAQYVICDLYEATEFEVEGREFKKGFEGGWHCQNSKISLHVKDRQDKLFIPVKLLYEGKGKGKEEFNDDKDGFNEDEIKELLAKKAKLTQSHDRRERELAKQKNKGIFDTVAEYLEKNQTGSDKYVLEINLDNSDDEEEPPSLACEVNGVKDNRMLDLLSASLEGPALTWRRAIRKTIKTWKLGNQSIDVKDHSSTNFYPNSVKKELQLIDENISNFIFLPAEDVFDLVGETEHPANNKDAKWAIKDLFKPLDINLW